MNNSICKPGLIAATVMLLSGNVAMAQTTPGAPQSQHQKVQLSLTEAMRMSLQNNKQLKLSSAKIEEAKASYHEAWNNHLPDFKISGSYLRVNSPTVDLKVKLGSGSGTGGSIKVEQAAYALANVSMPLFSGFRIKYGVESAKFLETAATLDAENDKEDVLQNTISAYSNLYKSFKTIELVKKSLEQQKKRVIDFNNMEENGVMAHNDVLKAQLQESNIELSLLDAESNYNVTCANMTLMLGLPEGSDLIPDSNAFSGAAEAGSVADWETSAIKNRKDVAALASREQAAALGIKSAKGEYYPGVAVTGGYIEADVPKLLTLTNALNIGIGLQYNVGSIWKTGAKIDAATARLHELEATKNILAERIDIQINQAYEAYLLSRRKIDVYAKAVEQSTENYRITKNKHDNNLVTTTELLEADIAQLQATLNYTFSKVDAAVAYNKLKQTAGTLLTDYHSIK